MGSDMVDWASFLWGVTFAFVLLVAFMVGLAAGMHAAEHDDR
ncbi:MAG: hypothetical protein PHR15_09680 [Atopobiaceae bacterium]|nr:hypothetical protein [Atopobiaceae bacterium]